MKCLIVASDNTTRETPRMSHSHYYRKLEEMWESVCLLTKQSRSVALIAQTMTTLKKDFLSETHRPTQDKAILSLQLLGVHRSRLSLTLVSWASASFPDHFTYLAWRHANWHMWGTHTGDVTTWPLCLAMVPALLVPVRTSWYVSKITITLMQSCIT